MRQYLDPELLNFASMIVREQIEKMSIKWKFNGKSVIRIAKMAVAKDKIQDEAWIRTQLKQAHKKEFENYIEHIAKRDGYFPFIQFRKKSYLAFKELYGEWPFVLMEKSLEDPARIGPAWAAQFIGAVTAIGVQECEKAENLFEFVTQHPEFEKAKDERGRYQDFLNNYRPI
ncbi:hypothetical protein [Pseudobacteriovorax antillogorgiicola]|uniref:hypothetical protein n=1 Tax=Pseudobacteriovorax antillogorgiicola TaxID=1513793 RepID=UPI0010533555|nr:hypothetical protein [Pseudobacteriovorax antillogorgiicola]